MSDVWPGPDSWQARDGKWYPLTDPPGPEPPAVAEWWWCIYCRGAIPQGAVKCQHCGEWLDRAVQKQVTNEPSEARKFFFGLILAVLILIPLIAFLGR
jgi:predicted nucleic acid-binding Zn ribbon protein